MKRRSAPSMSVSVELTHFRNFEITNELRLSHKFLQSIAGIQAGAASQKHPPVKVAIIDNGVDRILSTLSERIKKGQSFVENNRAGERRESPWWIAADPHGTQMASTVLEVNPCCDLYIGKAGRFRRDISLQSAVEVRSLFL